MNVSKEALLSQEAPWHQQKGEPALWFQRFRKYSLIGADRSILGSYNTWRRDSTSSEGEKEQDFLPSRSPSSAWSQAASRWS